MNNKFLPYKNKLIIISTILLLFISSILLAQQDFNKFYKNYDPAKDTISSIVKKSIYQDFIKKALNKKDAFDVILGNLYLANEYTIESDYTSAMNCLLQAGEFASTKNDTLLLGRVNHKKGAVFSIMQNNIDAIEQYEISLAQSIAAKDSQFIAITLEQLGALYGYEGDFDKANSYYQKALPLVEKYWKPKNLATSYSNYGKVLEFQDSIQKSIEAYKQAILISESIQDTYRIIPAKQHLALAYTKNGSPSKALELYEACIKVNTKNGWLDFLIYSYYGLSYTYEKMNNTDSAYHYFQKYYMLKDSIMGAQVYDQIAELEVEASVRKKDIEILTQKEATLRHQRDLKNTIITVIILLTIVSWLGLYFFYKYKKAKFRLAQNRKSLRDLTTLLAAKNAELRDLRSELSEVSEVSEVNKENVETLNLYDLKILTKADWNNFKSLFEKSYPNLLQKIRNVFSKITESEERLFLFIKLNLTNKEAADILGVKTESIIKSRMRLRKKLSLEKGENMNQFIQTFD